MTNFRFSPFPQSVALVDCAQVARFFPAIFRGWRIERDGAADVGGCLLSLRREAGAYRLDAPWLSSPFWQEEAADALCDLVAELLGALVAHRGGLLCLHGAAVQLGEGLVVFPNRFRAGKSTLTACFAAAGFRVFADDVVPIGPSEDIAIAPGIAPRLRLPLPDDLSETTRRFFEESASLQSSRYRYLDLPNDRIAPYGMRAPIKAFVLIERDPESRAELSPVGRSEVLRQAIYQNFARDGDASEILERLHRIVEQAGCYRLRYRRAEEAVALLAEVFGDGAADRPSARATGKTTSNGSARGNGAARPQHGGPGNGRLSEVTVGDEGFLADSEAGTIHHLNPLALAVWRLLEDRTDPQEMLDLLLTAFPDVPRQEIRSDLRAILESFESEGLVGPNGPGRAIACPDRRPPARDEAL